MTSVERVPHLEYPTFLAHIRSESARFREVMTSCDPAARVPSCPDWDAADLVWHLAEVQLFWSRVIRQRPRDPEQINAQPETRPETYEELLEAFDDFSRDLVTELEAADPAEVAWHWSASQTVATSYRRQAHEALIHRLDAEQTAGVEPLPLDPALAGDGVAELIEVMFGGEAPEWGRIERGDGRVAIELTDLGETLWAEPCTFLGTDPDSGKKYDGPHVLAVDDPGRPADVTVRGTAGALDTWLWKRGGDTGIEVSGDAATYHRFRAAVDHPID